MPTARFMSSDAEGYSISEAARLLNLSASTVTRRLRDGDLEYGPGARKGRVSAESVHGARAALAASLEMHVEGNCVGRDEYDLMVQRTIDLQAIVDDLRTAVASLNDALGRARPVRFDDGT